MCFGAPHREGGRTRWRIPQNMGHVDLGFLVPRVFGT
jgi:hypothetical protein